MFKIRSRPRLIGKRSETHEVHPGIFSCGFTLDSFNGPVRSGRQAIQKLFLKRNDPKNANYIEQISVQRVFEDEYSQTQLDALYAHSGWPPLASLPDRPWAHLGASPRAEESNKWATRRMLVSMWSTDFQTDDLSPTDAFVRAVEGALACSNEVSQTRALEEVFASWGDVIPVAAIVGCTITATGVLFPGTNLEPVSSFSDPADPAIFRDLNSFIDTQLQTEGKFERTLAYHVTGGRPDILLRQGFDAWLDDIKTTKGWDIIKVTQVIPIADILDHAIQQRIKQLYTNRAVLFRSLSVGSSPQLGFESVVSDLCPIQRIEIGFSDVRIESLSIRYADGMVAGPYGRPGDATQLDTFVLAQNEFVTDIFIWPSDYFIASVQLVKNTGYVSPIYGATRGITQPPRLLNGYGKALAGLSVGYDKTGIARLQAVWRHDLQAINYKFATTTFIGGEDGDFWNDLGFIGDRFSAQISRITARSPGNGYLSSFQTTYASLVDGYPEHQESPVHGTEEGPVTSWTLEEGQYIIGLRGRHDGTSICEIQFTTNRINKDSPTFGQPCGRFDFNFTAPETREGKKMMLHFMGGKSAGRVNSILFVWVDPSRSVQLKPKSNFWNTLTGWVLSASPSSALRSLRAPGSTIYALPKVLRRYYVVARARLGRPVRLAGDPPEGNHQ